MKRVVSAILLVMLLTSMLYSVFKIMPVQAVVTIYIRADGSIDPPTAPIQRNGDVYTLTGNIISDADGIVIERDDIMLSGADHMVQGTGVGTGITLSQRNNVTIENMEIKAFQRGIYINESSKINVSENDITCGYTKYFDGILLSQSFNNSVSGNIIRDNDKGISLSNSNSTEIRENNIIHSFGGVYLDLDSSYNSIYENDITNSVTGIMLFLSAANNKLVQNNATNNIYGIEFLYSSNNTMIGNVLDDNYYGFTVIGWELSHYIHSIETSNKVNGKPIHYLVNKKDIVIDPTSYPQIGCLALVNSTNAIIEGLTLEGNGDGVLLAYTNDSIVRLNAIVNNFYGMDLWNSSRNVLTENSITNNKQGIRACANSSGNTISENNIESNEYGTTLDWYSSDNIVFHNSFVNNTKQAINNNPTNVFDDGYPSGGNYWSDFNPPDVFSGSYQNETGSDKIGDTPYIIDANNTDNYPLIYPYGYVPSPDFNNDGIIDIFDLVRMALAFGSMPGMPNWDPYVDLNQDGIIDIFDLVVVALHFGETG
jgi:parallel beta-helix repeat protein